MERVPESGDGVTQVKLVFALWGAGDLLAAELAERLGAAGVETAQVNISDSAVAQAMVRLTAFDAPVQAVVSVWLRDEQGVEAVAEVLAAVADRVVGWRVEAVSPIELPAVAIGERAAGLSNIAFLRRPADQPYDEWLDYWRNQHTEIAIATQATFGYVQNRVIGAATDGAPEVAAVIEELFPIEALTDPHAFYGSGGDNAELARRFDRLMTSVAKFGADKNIDVVPTSRYRIL